MVIYVLSFVDFEGATILGVFTSDTAAKAYVTPEMIDKLNDAASDRYEIEAHVLDDPNSKFTRNFTIRPRTRAWWRSGND